MPKEVLAVLVSRSIWYIEVCAEWVFGGNLFHCQDQGAAGRSESLPSPAGCVEQLQRNYCMLHMAWSIILLSACWVTFNGYPCILPSMHGYLCVICVGLIYRSGHQIFFQKCVFPMLALRMLYNDWVYQNACFYPYDNQLESASRGILCSWHWTQHKLINWIVNWFYSQPSCWLRKALVSLKSSGRNI